jgi:hypothetical protein
MKTRASRLSVLNRFLPALTALLGMIVVFAHFRATHCDFDTYLIAGDRVLKGDFAGLYEPNRNAYGGFLYPLISALFFSAFALLGPFGGRLAFYLLLLGASVLILRFSYRFAQGPFRPLVLSIAGLLVFRSWIDCFQTGNIGILLMGGVIAAVEIGVRHPRTSDLLLGTIAALKPLGVFFLGLRFVLREWGRLALSVAVALYLIWMPFWVLNPSKTSGVGLFGRYLDVLANPLNFGGNANPHFQSLPGAIARFFEWRGGGHPVWERSVTVAILLTLFFWAVGWRVSEWSRWKNRTRELLAVFLGLCPLLYPGSWYHMGLCYLPMLVVLISRVMQAHSSKKVRAEWIALVAFFIFYSISGRSVFPRELSLWVEHRSLPAFAALFAFVVFRKRFPAN